MKKPSWFSEVIYLGPSLDRKWGLGQNLVPQWKTWKELVENCQHRPLCSSCCYYQFLVQWVKDDTIGTYGLSKSSSNFQLSTSIHKKINAPLSLFTDITQKMTQQNLFPNNPCPSSRIAQCVTGSSDLACFPKLFL